MSSAADIKRRRENELPKFEVSFKRNEEEMTSMKNFMFFEIIFGIILLLSLTLLIINPVNALNSGHIELLTVSESGNDTIGQGGVADLQLVIKPGTGRIFIDSFPLSKLDTQITTRFAAEMACDLLSKDCSGYDFFYTITANSAVVGGPSAGAAATVLTVAVLDNKVLNNSTIMTGTINSGDLVGPVAGIPEKTLAAQEYGYKRVLIPKWDIANNTPSENLTIQVIPISTLEEALYYFTGKNYTIADSADINSKEYTNIMSQVTIDLCSKYGYVKNNSLVLPNLTSYGMNLSGNNTDNFQLALDAINNQSYYSAASFCFGGNVKIAASLIKNLSNNQLKILDAQLLENISNFERQMDAKSENLSTISELETYMIVAERLDDAKNVISLQDMDNLSYENIAYARERFDTAVIWSKFFALSGQKFVMDKNLLKDVCTKKLSEAEERLNYLELYFSKPDLRDELSKSYDYYDRDEYALCIFTASKVKADADVVLSAVFVPDASSNQLLSEKLNAARAAIARQERANVFPILGYSYYEYANTLRPTDKYSALLYAEYSLELSNIDMYFKKGSTMNLSNLVDMNYVYALLVGILLGIVITTLFVRSRVSAKRSDYKKNYSKNIKNIKSTSASINRRLNDRSRRK